MYIVNVAANRDVRVNWRLKLALEGLALKGDAVADFVGAVDQGTTSTRFMIFDHSGAEVARHQLEHTQILGDTLIEGNETFTLTLSNPTNAVVDRDTATATIMDDDGTAALSVGDVTVKEGNLGSTGLASFTVFLLKPSALPVTFSFTTVSDTAVAGTDFTATSGSRTLAAGSSDV